jgi:hypothetical protein
MNVLNLKASYIKDASQTQKMNGANLKSKAEVSST